MKIRQFTARNLQYTSKRLEYLLKINTMAEENQSRVHCKKPETETEGWNPRGRNPSIPIFQALKDREYDGKFKKGTRIYTVKINVAPLAWRGQEHNIYDF